MFVAALRLIAAVVAALTLGLSFSHVLEMQAKLAYPPELYATVNNTLYGSFGAYAALLEPTKIVLCGVLCLLLRRQRRAFAWTLAATVCFVAALVVWVTVVSPVNQANLAAFMAGGEEASVRAWAANRLRWEWGHAASFVFQLFGVGALIASFLVRQRASPPSQGSLSSSIPQPS